MYPQITPPLTKAIVWVAWSCCLNCYQILKPEALYVSTYETTTILPLRKLVPPLDKAKISSVTKRKL